MKLYPETNTTAEVIVKILLLSALLPCLLAVRPVKTPTLAPAKDQVRIALSLTPWRKFVPHNNRGQPTYRRTKERKLTLRAALSRTSHFYFGDWHFVTRPVLWSRQTRQYKTRLTIFQRLGKDRKIEEKIGTLVASGTLKAYRDLYILQNFQKKTFKDANGSPRLRVVMGFTHDDRKRRVADARAKKKR